MAFCPRDKLEESWGRLFGPRRGIMIETRLYENVSRHKKEVRELAAREKKESIVLAFDPRPPQEMLVACLSSSPAPPWRFYVPYAIADERWIVRRDTVLLSHHMTAVQAEDAARMAAELLAERLARAATVFIQTEKGS